MKKYDNDIYNIILESEDFQKYEIFLLEALNLIEILLLMAKFMIEYKKIEQWFLNLIITKIFGHTQFSY